MNAIDSFAFRIFGGFLLKHEDKFAHFKVTLRQAQTPVPVLHFVSTSIFYSLLAGFFGGVGGLVAGKFLFRGVTPEQIVSSLHVSSRVTGRFDTPTLISEHLPLLLAIVAGLLLFSLVASLSWGLIMILSFHEGRQP